MTLPNGIHTMSEGDYFALPHVNQSTLKAYGKSPKHARYQETHPRDSTAMALGRAAHCMILQPGEFDSRFCAFDGKVRRGKQWDAFKAANSDLQILTASELDHVQAMAKSVKNHLAASELLVGGTAEQTVLWDCEGTPCKARFDYHQAFSVIDLKTTRDASPDAFGRDAWQFGYHIQAAFYVDALRHACPGLANANPGPDFKIIAVESAAPHDVVVYTLDREIIEAGRRRYLELLSAYKSCVGFDQYPGISAEPLALTVPGYAHKDVYGE